MVSVAFQGIPFSGVLLAEQAEEGTRDIQLTLVATSAQQIPSQVAVTKVFRQHTAIDIGLIGVDLPTVTEERIRTLVISTSPQDGRSKLCFDSQSEDPEFFLGPGAIRITELVGLSAAVKLPHGKGVIRYAQVSGILIPPRFLQKPPSE